MQEDDCCDLVSRRNAMLCYAAKTSQNLVQQERTPQASPASPKILLVTVARWFATRPIGPTLKRQGSGVYHYDEPKHAQNDISNPLLFRAGNSFEVEHCLRRH